ncbi:MAG: VanZ family protein [Erysipelotrichaceae bacterium]|jgi:glycopeptide antibiotics resistance protein|nr:VanZ family protein [Erysipelotrichaceae bacterium]
MKEIIDFIVLILLYVFILYKKWKVKGKDVLLVNTIMYIYLSFVLYFTLMPIITALPFIFNHPYISMNLVPFIDVLDGRGDFARQVGLNVVMTIPFGFLLPLVKKANVKVSKVVLYTFLLSLFIELLQPLINDFRSSDITDLITNVIGGFIGYLLYLIFKPLTTRVLNYINKN